MFSASFLAILVGLLLGCMGIPTSSEILLPLVGAMIKNGQVPLAGAIAACVVIQVIGSIIAYWIARTGGIKIVERYGKYIFFSEHKLAIAQQVFRRNGKWMVLVGRCTPILVSYISFPAGLAQMPFASFVAMSTIGAVIWVGALTWLGYTLAGNLGVLTHNLHRLSYVVAFVLVAAVVWYAVKLKTRKP